MRPFILLLLAACAAPDRGADGGDVIAMRNESSATATVNADEQNTVRVPVRSTLKVRSFAIPVVRPDLTPHTDIDYDKATLELVRESMSTGEGEGATTKIFELRALREGATAITIRLVAPDGRVKRANTIRIEVTP
ncbi:MAG TPA: hypothetical protein VM733_01130 [Thermoanaerobaculia bacterium]|nr:hypothetical protein [Thermoanaerobaculia bacterium]